MINKDYIYFENLTLDHVYKMKDWGHHTDPLFQDYNFDFKNEEGARAFFRQKTLLPINKYYAVIYSEEVIGFIGNKNINPITKSSTLGYVLNPSLVNMSFGSLALGKFLNFYFTEKKMKRMDLLVAGYNLRARRVYEKLGFREVKTLVDLYPNGNNIDETSETYKDIRKEFVRKDGLLYNLVYKMELRKEDYNFEI